MKQTLYLVTLILSIGQVVNSVILDRLKLSNNSGKVEYSFVTSLHGNQIEQNSELLFENGKSIFVYAKGKKGIVAKQVTIKNKNGEEETIEDGYFQDEFGTVIYKDLLKKKCVIREIVWTTPYLTSEPTLPIQKWLISSEQRKIGKFKTQKATTTFRGRKYTAWFCSEIPVSDGPWKLNGLPGLILEANDESNEIKFLFKNIEIPYLNDKIDPPTTGEKVTFENYKRADELEFLKMKKQVLSQQDGRGTMEVKRQLPNLLEKSYDD